jgi:hypothetical protein
MARFAVRVSAINGEPDVVRDERTVARECQLALGGRERRRQEGVPALGAEEVLLVIRALPSQLRVVERDETLFDDGRLATVTPRGKVLSK